VIGFALGLGAAAFAIARGIQNEEREGRRIAAFMGCRCGSPQFRMNGSGYSLG